MPPLQSHVDTAHIVPKLAARLTDPDARVRSTAEAALVETLLRSRWGLDAVVAFVEYIRSVGGFDTGVMEQLRDEELGTHMHINNMVWYETTETFKQTRIIINLHFCEIIQLFRKILMTLDIHILDRLPINYWQVILAIIMFLGPPRILYLGIRAREISLSLMVLMRL